MKNVIIAVDFDGTCVRHEFPEVGKNIGAEIVLKVLAENGVRIILHTMRGKETIQPAIDWFAKYGIPLYGINENKSQKKWTDSKKVYANMYIDDCGACIPLVTENYGGRPYVDWKVLNKYMHEAGLISFGQYSDIRKSLDNYEY